MPRLAIAQTNVGAFLDMLAVSEIGRPMLEDPESDDGYKIIVGSRPGNLILMDSYDDHPNRLITLSPKLKSTAAGRYQALYRYWPHYKALLKLPDFGPESQDAYAIQQIKEQKAYQLIVDGRIPEAIDRCRNIWASLPGAGYGQHEHSLEHLVEAYQQAGGSVA